PAAEADLDVSDSALGDPDDGPVVAGAVHESRFRIRPGSAPEPDEDAVGAEEAPAAVVAIAERPGDLEPRSGRSVERDLREKRRRDAFLAGCGERRDESQGSGAERNKCETSQDLEDTRISVPRW